MLNIYQSCVINEALLYLKSVPQVERMFLNLPSGIGYNVDKNLPGLACYDSRNNIITINELVFNCNMDAKQQLIFLTTLTHELCHASQKKAGLCFNDLIDASFDETFRISRMTEIESILLEAIVENELIKRKEFKNCEPSGECLFYQHLLEQTNGDVQQANKIFILSYWKNSMVGVKENSFIESFKTKMADIYHGYVAQSYRQSIAIHKYNLKSANRIKPVQAMGKYLERMNLHCMLPEIFFKDTFDNIEITKNVENGVTVLDQQGNKCYKYSPTNKQNLNILTYFKDGQPDKCFMQDSIDKTQVDITNIVINFQKLEKAIKERNLIALKQIFNANSWILDAQMLPDGDFPILMAIRNNNPEAVSFILEKSPNLLLTTIDGRGIVTELNKLTNKTLRAKIQYLYVQQIKAQMLGDFSSEKNLKIK